MTDWFSIAVICFVLMLIMLAMVLIFARNMSRLRVELKTANNTIDIQMGTIGTYRQAVETLNGAIDNYKTVLGKLGVDA